MGNVTLTSLLRCRGVPLYLEWAPANILSQSSTSKSDEKSDAAVGEHDAKRVILEQSVEGISEMDIDPDRIEVRHKLFLLCICFVLSSFSFFFP